MNLNMDSFDKLGLPSFLIDTIEKLGYKKPTEVQAKAIPKALTMADLKINNIDQIELNEAFSSQSLSVIKDLNLNPEIINVNGGAIALGHPLGMTGAKLSISLINELIRNKQKYGIVTACVGGGQGVCGIFENLTL